MPRQNPRSASRSRAQEQSIEELINRANQLEVTAREVRRENEESRQGLRSLTFQGAQQVATRELPEERVFSEEDLGTGDIIRILNSDSPVEQAGVVVRLSRDRAHLRFCETGRLTWRMHSSAAKLASNDE